MSIELTTMVKKTVKVKSVYVHAKVSDRGCYSFRDEDGKEITNRDEDYVPSFFPEDHYGDYLQLDIDLATGKILNWRPPTPDQVKDAMTPEDD